MLADKNDHCTSELYEQQVYIVEISEMAIMVCEIYLLFLLNISTCIYSSTLLDAILNFEHKFKSYKGIMDEKLANLID